MKEFKLILVQVPDSGDDLTPANLTLLEFSKQLQDTPSVVNREGYTITFSHGAPERGGRQLVRSFRRPICRTIGPFGCSALTTQTD